MTEKNSHPDQKARLEQLSKYRIETVHGVKQDVVFNSYPEGITVDESLSTNEYVDKIVSWHHDRNLIEGSSDKDQFCKLVQEAGELSDSICPTSGNSSFYDLHLLVGRLFQWFANEDRNWD